MPAPTVPTPPQEAEAGESSASSEPEASPGVQWKPLLLESLGFLALEHGFRFATEPATRHPHRAFFPGYVSSLNGLHGWSDGDPFFVNYIGHPIQGSASGFLFVENDPAYRTAIFGKNRRYWKSRLRAAAYSWAYSELFELGPFSEANIGAIQSAYPQQGFVDQVITPAVGLAWMIGEDAIDKYFLTPFEQRYTNPYARLLLRSVLNPTRSLANVLTGRLPWNRDTRTGVFVQSPLVSAEPRQAPAKSYPDVPSFEFLATARIETFTSTRGGCIGGGGAGAFRLNPNWQLVGDVSGCTLTGLGPNRSGDSLTYLVGPRWTDYSSKRWQPHAQLLLGGRTLTLETIDPVRKALVQQAAAQQGVTPAIPPHSLYARNQEITGFTVSAGAGIDVRLTSALALRPADLAYTHSWHSRLDGMNYANSLQFTSGLVLRFGTW